MNRKLEEVKRSAKQSKNKAEKKIIIIILVFLLFCATVFFSFSFFIRTNLEAVGKGELTGIEIPLGYSLDEVAQLLESEELIRDAFAFKYFAKREDLDQVIQAGYYEISPDWTVEEIMEKLMTGEVQNKSFTIPEGKNIEEMAAILKEKNICASGDFVDETKKVADYQKQYSFLKDIPLEANNGESRSLEGYLFPDTYKIKKNATAEEVVLVMLDRFEEIYTPEYLKRTAEMDKTIDDIVILASVIELEAGHQEDREPIASVFYNRLDQDMLLEADSTTNYARGDKKVILTTEQTRIDSPYNTYVYPGLPFGPIGSPGEESLQAALYPAQTDYFFFVSNIETGKTYFNKTYEEHLKDVDIHLASYPAGQ